MDPRPSKRRKTMPAVHPIMQLNYDCLRYVFSYLNVRDLIYLEKVCKRFKDVAQDVCKTQRELDISKLIHHRRLFRGTTRINAAESEKIFSRVGPYVEILRLSEREIHGIRPLRFIWKYCRNLKEVYFNKIDFRHDEYAINLQPVFKNVTIAHMINCYDLNDFRLETMFNLKQLKVLKVPTTFSNASFRGYFLQQLHNIEELNLDTCMSLDPYATLLFFQSNTTLRSLNFDYCKAIDEDCLWAIAAKLANLECLHFLMDTSISVECYLALMDLPKLKELKILHHPYETVWDIGVLISKLAAHNRLECLDINFRSKYVTPETWDALRNFTNLKELDIWEIDSCPHMELIDMSSADTLEVLGVSYTKISNLGMETLIENFKNIRTIKASSCKDLTNEMIPNIMKHLAGRRHKLTIQGWIPHSLGIRDRIPDYNRDLLEFVYDKFY